MSSTAIYDPGRRRSTGGSSAAGMLIGFSLFVIGVSVGSSAVILWQRSQPAPPATAPAQDEPPREWEATIFIPIVDNEGKEIPPEYWHKHTVEYLTTTLGEGARLGPEQTGFWFDTSAGQLKEEKVRPLIISFPKSKLEAFREAVREIGKRLHQEEMYVRFEESPILRLPVNPKIPEKQQ